MLYYILVSGKFPESGIKSKRGGRDGRKGNLFGW